MKVAFGKVVITPENYLGMTLAGYTPVPKCTGKLDDIYAHGVLIEDIEQGNITRRLLFISLDALFVTLTLTNYIKEQIQKRYFITPGQIVIHAVHTHKSVIDASGLFEHQGGILNVLRRVMCPGNAKDRYLVTLTRQIVNLVGKLIEKLVPCKMAWAREKVARTDIVVNRRHPARRSRPDVGVIAFRGVIDDRFIGFIMHFACHGTTLGFATTQLSADWMGRAVALVEERTGGKVATAYFNGPSGDLNPITTCGTEFEFLEHLKKKTLLYDQVGTYKSSKRIGRAIGTQALRLAQSIPSAEFLPHLHFQAYIKTFWIPMKGYKYFNPKTWFQNQIFHFLKKYLLLRVAITHEKPNFPGFAIKHKANRIYLYSMLQWISITTTSKDGSNSKRLSILTAPGELFEDIGKLLSKRCPNYPDAWIFQNSIDWIGYILPKQEYIDQSGYEPILSFAPVIGEYYQREMLTLFDEVAIGINLSFS